MFTESDKKHIEQYHHSCYVTKYFFSYIFYNHDVNNVYVVHQRVKQLEEVEEKKKDEEKAECINNESMSYLLFVASNTHLILVFDVILIC